MENGKILVIAVPSGMTPEEKSGLVQQLESLPDTDTAMIITSDSISGQQFFTGDELAKLERMAVERGISLHWVLEMALGLVEIQKREDLKLKNSIDDLKEAMLKIKYQADLPAKKPRRYGHKKWHPPAWYE